MCRKHRFCKPSVRFCNLWDIYWTFMMPGLYFWWKTEAWLLIEHCEAELAVAESPLPCMPARNADTRARQPFLISQVWLLHYWTCALNAVRVERHCGKTCIVDQPGVATWIYKTICPWLSVWYKEDIVNGRISMEIRLSWWNQKPQSQMKCTLWTALIHVCALIDVLIHKTLEYANQDGIPTHRVFTVRINVGKSRASINNTTTCNEEICGQTKYTKGVSIQPLLSAVKQSWQLLNNHIRE